MPWDKTLCLPSSRGKSLSCTSRPYVVQSACLGRPRGRCPRLTCLDPSLALETYNDDELDHLKKMVGLFPDEMAAERKGVFNIWQLRALAGCRPSFFNHFLGMKTFDALAPHLSEVVVGPPVKALRKDPRPFPASRESTTPTPWDWGWDFGWPTPSSPIETFQDFATFTGTAIFFTAKINR